MEAAINSALIPSARSDVASTFSLRCLINTATMAVPPHVRAGILSASNFTDNAVNLTQAGRFTFPAAAALLGGKNMCQ